MIYLFSDFCQLMAGTEVEVRDAEPNVTLHPRFVVVEDDPYIKLKDVPKEEKVISRAVYGKESALFSRNVGGKTCWFKVDDKVSETGNICFANGVSPDSKEYMLQDLLHRMDKVLIDDYHQSRSAVVADDEIHKKVQKLERTQQLNKTIFAIDTQDDDDIPNKKKGKKKHGEKKSDRRTGRTVLYLTVGQMKHTRMFLKPRPQSEVN